MNNKICPECKKQYIYKEYPFAGTMLKLNVAPCNCEQLKAEKMDQSEKDKEFKKLCKSLLRGSGLPSWALDDNNAMPLFDIEDVGSDGNIKELKEWSKFNSLVNNWEHYLNKYQ